MTDSVEVVERGDGSVTVWNEDEVSGLFCGERAFVSCSSEEAELKLAAMGYVPVRKDRFVEGCSVWGRRETMPNAGSASGSFPLPKT